MKKGTAETVQILKKEIGDTLKVWFFIFMIPTLIMFACVGYREETRAAVHEIRIESPFQITRGKQFDGVELRLPDEVEYLSGSSFVADHDSDSEEIRIGDQVIVIMLKRDRTDETDH